MVYIEILDDFQRSFHLKHIVDLQFGNHQYIWVTKARSVTGILSGGYKKERGVCVKALLFKAIACGFPHTLS